MEKGTAKENSRYISRRNTIVSGEHLVAIVPLIRILNGASIHAPADAIPAAADRAKHTSRSRAKNHPCHHPLMNTLKIEFYSRHRSPPVFAPIPVFFEKNFYTLAQALTDAILAKIS